MIDRKGIVIYFANKKVIKTIKQQKVNIAYINQNGKYLTGYCNAEDYPQIKKVLKKHRLIRKVDESKVDMPAIDF